MQRETKKNKQSIKAQEFHINANSLEIYIIILVAICSKPLKPKQQNQRRIATVAFSLTIYF